MISDDIIKKEFVTKTISRGAKKIFDLQSDVVQSVLHERTGRLFADMKAKRFVVGSDSKYFTVSATILNYLRFNEIRSNNNLRGKLHLYNRIVWGVLYGETLPALKFGLTDEMKAQIRKQIQDAGIQLEIPFTK